MVELAGKLASISRRTRPCTNQSAFTFSGKSSLVLLLQRLLEPLAESGHVSIDGLRLDQIPRSAVRQCIITLPQNAFLLPEGCKVRDSLDLGLSDLTNATQDDDAAYALRTVGLWDLIQEWGGLDSQLKPDSLSQGQRQLFCLARAVLRSRTRHHTAHTAGEQTASQGQGGILILDEFNSGVDIETDKSMQAIIRREFAGYTVICVAHRLDTVLDYDKAVVMEKGRVSEVGNPKELLRRSDGVLRELWLVGKGEGDGGETDGLDD